jgi:F-type H+-transporting ATPase subunit delta
MADNITVARPYARATFELANDAGELGPWSESLTIGGQLLADKTLVEYLGNPEFNDEQRLDFLAGLFAKAGAKVFAGQDKRGTNFVKLLLENGRAAVLPEISTHFEALKAKVENSVDAIVTSATKLSEKQVDEIATALKARLGCDVKIETEIDENLIGGAVIRAGDVVIDGSLRSSLEGLTNALIS